MSPGAHFGIEGLVGSQEPVRSPVVVPAVSLCEVVAGTVQARGRWTAPRVWGQVEERVLGVCLDLDLELLCYGMRGDQPLQCGDAGDKRGIVPQQRLVMMGEDGVVLDLLQGLVGL